MRELNERLKELYYYEGTPGSTYNNATVAAVKRLQADLACGRPARPHPLCRAGCSPPARRNTAAISRSSAADSNDRVARLQRRLRELNYYSANITGNFGSVTQAAWSCSSRPRAWT